MFTFGWGGDFSYCYNCGCRYWSKDLPKFIKQIGLLTKNIKKVSSDFKSSLNDLADEAEIKEIANSVKEVKKKKMELTQKKF